MKRIYLYIFIIIFSLSSCKKEISSTGASALSLKDAVLSGVDTFTLNTSSVLQDSIISSNPAYLLLGSYADPVFGKSTASFYSQVRITSISPNFGSLSTLTVDSVVVGIQVSDYYGDLTPQYAQIYRITEDLSSSKTYYTNSSVQTDGVNLVLDNDKLVTPKPLGYYFVDNNKDSIWNQIRIRIKPEIGDLLINQSVTSPTTYSSVESFTSWFKGLHINLKNDNLLNKQGSIFSISSSPQLIVYYHQNGVSKKYNYELNSNGVRFNNVNVNLTNSKVEEGIKSNNVKEFYAQANNIRASIKIPYLNTVSSNSVIQSATLILPYDLEDVKSYSPSNEVSVSIPTSLTDHSLRVIGYGVIDTINKYYVIDIRDHVQHVISMKRLNYGLFVAPKFFSTSAERIRFNNEFSDKKPKLYIKYSSY